VSLDKKISVFWWKPGVLEILNRKVRIIHKQKSSIRFLPFWLLLNCNYFFQLLVYSVYFITHTKVAKIVLSGELDNSKPFGLLLKSFFIL